MFQCLKCISYLKDRPSGRAAVGNFMVSVAVFVILAANGVDSSLPGRIRIERKRNAYQSG